MRHDVKRFIFFIPVWICLIFLSIIREILFFKVKTYRRKRQRDKFDRVCQSLYSVIRNPYRIQIGSPWIPGYFLPRRRFQWNKMPVDCEMISQLQQLCNSSSDECIEFRTSKGVTKPVAGNCSTSTTSEERE